MLFIFLKLFFLTLAVPSSLPPSLAVHAPHPILTQSEQCVQLPSLPPSLPPPFFLLLLS